jgi:hypothetical protein
MNANYNASSGHLPRYTKYSRLHMYFIARGMGLLVDKDMDMDEICCHIYAAEEKEN